MAGFEVITYGRFPETSLFKVGDFDVRSVVRAREMACFFFWGRCIHANGLLPAEAGSSVLARTCSSLRRLARVAFRAFELYAAAQLFRVARFAC